MTVKNIIRHLMIKLYLDGKNINGIMVLYIMISIPHKQGKDCEEQWKNSKEPISALI
jgi:hypothetical protein